jgi:hypothetical protein
MSSTDSEAHSCTLLLLDYSKMKLIQMHTGDHLFLRRYREILAA